MKPSYLLVLLVAANAAHAQPTPAKQALITKILKIQQPAIEALSRALVEQPAAQMAQQAGVAIQTQVPAERKDTVAKEIQADLKKYVDEATPVVRERAIKLGPTTIGKVLDENFDEKELSELAGILQAPVYRKFIGLGPAMERALGQPLVTETRPLIEPKVRALEQKVSSRLKAPPSKAAPSK